MIRTTVALVIALMAGPALSASATYEATVEKLLVDERFYGTCMAFVSPGPHEQQGLTCAGNYVTFSCSGDFNSKAAGNQKFSSAQLALVTGAPVTIQVVDDKKHNGYCFVPRIDNVKAPS